MAETALLYRMVLPGHVCPYGLKALDLLRRRGFAVDDRRLATREATDALKAELGVATTPQVFIGGRRIGGYDDLRRHLGASVRASGEESYRPLLAIFGTTAALALAASEAAFGTPITWRALVWFVGFSMAVLAMLKLQDLERFSTMFLNYDLLARRFVPYARLYPFLEAGAGVLMVAGVAWWLAAPVSLLIGGIGAVSVIKAVYVERRSLRCACVGGSAAVPLGPVSLLENLAMVGMGLTMVVMR